MAGEVLGDGLHGPKKAAACSLKKSVQDNLLPFLEEPRKNPYETQVCFHTSTLDASSQQVSDKVPLLRCGCGGLGQKSTATRLTVEGALVPGPEP